MKKILFVTVLIFCLLGTTQTAYGFYEKDKISVLNDQGVLYTINSSTTETTKNLIPMGSVLGINDTYAITYTYQVYIEKGITLDSKIADLTLSNTFSGQTNGELVEITIRVSMNNIEELHNITTNFSQNLSFSYLLTVSKA